MNLAPGELRFGVAPEILVPAACRLAEMRSFSLEDLARALGAPVSEVEPVFKAMLREGFIQLAEGLEEFTHTEKLRQLANAKISHGITRAEAEKLLARVISMAEQINAQPDVYPYGVACIVVFGSFLGERPVLGDLDLGVQITEPDHRTREQAIEIMDAFRSGRSLPHSKTYAALRLRQPKKISLHQLEEVIVDLATPYKVVFGELPAKYRADRERT